MKKLAIVLAAAGVLGVAAPASAQVYFGADPGGVGVAVGPLGVGVGPDWGWRHRHWRGAYAYADNCRVIRERVVRPSGRVVYRSRQVCY